MTMGRLLYFYPENDMALAVGSPGYTAPEQAARLRLSGEALPLWYGEAGDRVLTSGINAAWYDAMQRDFGITADVFDFDCAGLTPEPWGWSLPVRNIYGAQGMPEALMPDNDAMARIRTLSNRQTSIDLARSLAEVLSFMASTGAVAVADPARLPEILAERGRVIVKQPWSSSGRGIIDSLNMTDDDVIRQTTGIIRRQGSAIVENVLARCADFAMLFRNSAEGMSFAGLSVFNTDHRYCYAGNMVASQEILRKHLETLVPAEQLDALQKELTARLRDIIGDAYHGPLGVDIMVTENGLAISELNLRNTMGHVCAVLGERYLEPGITATFSIVPAVKNGSPSTYVARNKRLVSGILDLVPGRFFTFRLSK